MIKHLTPKSKLRVYFSCWEKAWKNLAIIAFFTLIAQIIIVSLQGHWATLNVFHVVGWATWLIIIFIIHTLHFFKVLNRRINK